MADEPIQTAADSAGATGGDTAGMVPQDKVNRLEAKWRREAEAASAKAAELEAKLTQYNEAQKTEAEKAIEKARKEAATQTSAEWERRLNDAAINSELKLELLKRGMDPDLALVVKGKADLKSVDEIPDAIEAALGGKEWLKAPAKPAAPMQGGAPTGVRSTSQPKTLADLQRFVMEHGHAAVTDEMWQQINKGEWGK